MSDVKKIQLPNGTTYDIRDNRIVSLTKAEYNNITPDKNKLYIVEEDSVPKIYKFYMGSELCTDTKNTAGSTDTSNKIYLIGATSQEANPQTYSDNEVYATDGTLTTKKIQVGGTAATMQYNSTDQSIEFVFT